MYILYRTGYLQKVCGLWARGNNHHQLKGIRGGKCGEWLKVEGREGVNAGRGQIWQKIVYSVFQACLSL